ncbi:MAG: DUF2726 domain-containing protein, partial [Nitrososphaerales archaeon]
MPYKLKLLNSYEEITNSKLKEVCDSNGAHVFPKVRIADVFKLDGSGISASLFEYALKSHFDFIVTDKDLKALFSVEFDGPLHTLSADQKQRDQKKNELCDHFKHSLLRINSLYLDKTYRGVDLLSYFVNAWFLEDAFNDAQTKGILPYDETFDLNSIWFDSGKPDQKWPYWLSLDIQLAFQKLHNVGTIAQPVASHIVGLDKYGNYRCLSWLKIDEYNLVKVLTGIRAQRFPSVSEADLISMLAMFDLYEQIKKAVKGEKKTICISPEL